MSRSRKAAATLAVLLAFGAASAALADVESQIVYGALVERSASTSAGRTRVLNDVESAALRREGIAGRSRVWIRLTEPGGKSIHINLEHVTAVRSDTQIPGARAQLDLTSGKFQAVQENIEQVMQLIFATQGAAGNAEPDDMM
jgi:Tfp pilus assembly protein PilX